VRVLASVVNDQFDNAQYPPSRDLFASTTARLTTVLTFERPGPPGPPLAQFVRFFLDLTGLIPPSIDCGLLDELPPLNPPCAEALVATNGVLRDIRTGEVVRPGPLGAAAILSVNASNFSTRRRSLVVTVPNVVYPDAHVSLAPLQVSLQAEVKGRGLVNLHNTATIYAETPQGTAFVGGVTGNVGTGRPDFALQAGQAVPAPGGSLAIAPASGVLAPGQAFDLVLVAQTAGQTITGMTATFDGADITAPLGACLAAHSRVLTLGTPGIVLACPGLNGSLLGPGTHTLAVTLALSGGGTLADTAVWEVPGAGPVASAPRVVVSPASGEVPQSQAFDLVLFLDLAGRSVTGGQIALDGADVTAPLAACLVSSPLATGQLVVRCPGLSAGLFGLGARVLEVTLNLSDGSAVQAGAVWHVLADG
jgi:hypothetical protein